MSELQYRATAYFIGPDMWPAAQLVGLFHEVCYEQRVLYQKRNQNANELRQRPVTAWKYLEQLTRYWHCY